MKADEQIETEGPSLVLVRRARAELEPLVDQLERLRRQEAALMGQLSDDLEAAFKVWLALREGIQRLEMHVTFLNRFIEALTPMAGVGR